MNFDEAQGLITPPLRETITTLRRIRRAVVSTNDSQAQQRFLVDAMSLGKIAAISLTQASFSEDDVFFQAWGRVISTQKKSYRSSEPLAKNTPHDAEQLHPAHWDFIKHIRWGDYLETRDGSLYGVPAVYLDPRWKKEGSGVFAPLSVDFLFYSIAQRQVALETGQTFDLAPVAQGQGKVITLKDSDSEPIFEERESIGIAIYNMGGGGTYLNLRDALLREYPARNIHPLLTSDTF